MPVTPSVLKLQTSRDNIQKANDQENTISKAESGIVQELYPRDLYSKQRL